MAHAAQPTEEIWQALQALERRIAALERGAAATAAGGSPMAPPDAGGGAAAPVVALAGLPAGTAREQPDAAPTEAPGQRVAAPAAAVGGGAAAAPAAAESPGAAPAAAEEAVPGVADLTRVLTLTGRTLLIFGGGYLLRALTSENVLPQAAGVLLAVLYALAWLVLADRTGARGATASASFLGATAVLLGLPLLWESTARFHYLGPAAAGLGLGAFCAAALAVAWRRRLPGLAWVVALTAPAAALALVAATRAAPPFGGALVLVGLGGVLLYHTGWRGFGWATALLGALGALVVLPAALAQGRDTVAAMAVGVALCLAYLASLTMQARGREIDAFTALQAPLAALAGFGGAALLAARLGPPASALLGTLGLVLAAAAYWIAFAATPRERRRKLLLASTLAVAFVLAGTALLLPPAPRALAWSALAALAGWQAVARNRVTLALHGATYAVAAGAASGLLGATAYAFVAPATAVWPPLRPEAFAALGAAALLCALPVPRPAAYWKAYAELTRTLQIIVLVTGAAGAALELLLPLVPMVAGEAGPMRDPGLLATLRTAVLCAAALLLGWAARFERFDEARRLVYPALVLAAVKLLAEDFRVGRPATLVVCLALCGAAFILAPRLARRAG